MFVMLNVLLVDDEYGAIEAMKHVVEWNDFGFQIGGQANNADQALEMIAQTYYSLIITDIRMPGLNGIEMIRAIRKLSNVPVIVMSGFEHFSYAKECFKLGVKDYLLKPVIRDDLTRVLNEVKNEFIREKQIHYGLPALREQLFNRWVSGHLRQDEVMAQFALLHIHLDKYIRFGCMVFEVEFSDLTDSYWTESEMRIVRFSVCNIVEEVLGSKGYLFRVSTDRYGIVLLEKSVAFGQSEMLEIAHMIRINTKQYAKVNVTIGVSHLSDTAYNVQEAFILAEKLLDRKFLISGQSIISSDQFFESHTTSLEKRTECGQSVLEAVKHGDRTDVHSILSEQMRECIEAQTSKESVQSMMIELFVHLYQFLQEKSRQEEDIFQANMKDYLSIMEYKTIEKLFDYVEQKCLSIIDYVSESPTSPPHRMVQQVKRIISEEYGENISLRSIANQMYINPAYLGRIFKAYEGISFNDYLMRYRMEKAKALLETTEKKVYEIATQVGYKQLDWFYKKFKEYTGASTSDYRKASG